ncbi:hypothetical protein AB2373_17010 [Vibrio cholerae]|uniref:hypothetical protein n=1 Tax=Vibrio cholerae TaxID=666 RepID=UPI003F9D4928|nr:hypothetical protein [Vibrio cholerae]
MAKSIIQFKCLLMSPGDVSDEREAASMVISHWNAQIGEAIGAKVELVRWETHSQPELGKHPQKLLNDQMVEDADFGIGIFWSKLGTPTDTHDSGTVEEIDGLINKGAKVSLYISNKAIPQNMSQDYQRLSEYIDSIKHNGLFQYFSSTSEFRELLLLHLTKTVVDLLYKEKGVDDLAATSLGYQNVENNKPNVVIKTDGAIVPNGHGGTKYYLCVTTQNHSPNSVFIGGIQIKLSDNRTLFYQRDALLNKLNSRKELHSGESHTFYFDPIQINKDLSNLNLISHVSVSDDIDRIYESEKGKLSDLVKSLISL